MSLLPCKSGIKIVTSSDSQHLPFPLVSNSDCPPEHSVKIILFSEPSRGTGTETEPWPCRSFDVLFPLLNAALTALMLSIDVQTPPNTIF